MSFPSKYSARWPSSSVPKLVKTFMAELRSRGHSSAQWTNLGSSDASKHAQAIGDEKDRGNARHQSVTRTGKEARGLAPKKRSPPWWCRSITPLLCRPLDVAQVLVTIQTKMAAKTEVQFTIEQLEDVRTFADHFLPLHSKFALFHLLTIGFMASSIQKVLRMVEIAAITCEKLSTMKSDVEQEAIAALGTEYIGLARDIKISLKEHVLRISDVPARSSPANALKDYRELETWALKTEIVLKQLSVISKTFPSTTSENSMQTESAR